MHAGQIDVTPGAESPGRHHLAPDPPSPFFEDHQPDHAAVHQNGVADGDVINQSVVVHID